MFVKYQNISIDVLSKFSSPDVKINDTGRINSKDFTALLSYLISKDENKIYGFESTGVGSICDMRHKGETSLSGKVNLFENDSVSLFAGEDEMLDAELILQSDSEKNISIPVTIIWGGNYIDTEPDKVVLSLFIDTNALDYTEKENLSKTQNGTKFNENYIVSRVSIEKFVIETTGKDTNLPQFVLYTSLDETPLVVKPLETVSSDTSIIKLLHKYSSSGEHIEIAIVVKSDTSVKLESESVPAITISNNNIENNIKVDSVTLEYLQYARINNQYVIASDLNTAGDVVCSPSDEPAQIFNSPEIAGRESDVVKEFGGRIINNSDKNVENMSHKAGIDTGIESTRDILPSQFPQELERTEGFPDHYITFYENETEYSGQNHDVDVTSDDAETMIKDKLIIENSPSSGMIRESSTANLADSENIFVEVINVPDNTVDSDDNSFHIYKGNVESDRAGKTVTAQHIPDKGVSDAEVIHESEKTVKNLKSNSKIRISDKVGNSERSVELNVTNKDNLKVVNVSENNKAEEIATDMNGNLPRSFGEKLGIVRNTGGTEYSNAETDSPDSGNLSLNNVETRTQNEFHENPEFLNDRELTKKQLSVIEKVAVDNKTEVNTDSREHYFGLQVTSGNTGESISSFGLVTYSGQRTYNEADEKQILNSIVRQARFMSQKGLSSAVIKLEPPNLGRMQLDIITDHSRVTGRIVVESQEIKELIQANISQLCESLAQNGLKVDSFDVHIGHNDGSNNWARMEVFKNFANTKRHNPSFANNSTVPAEEQAIISKTVRNKSMYSEIFDVWI